MFKYANPFTATILIELEELIFHCLCPILCENVSTGPGGMDGWLDGMSTRLPFIYFISQVFLTFPLQRNGSRDWE